ncbi:MAG TPA: TetR/AcrR family transcriptional regulator [Fusibacter sp.]|nr:TetR/AcrR family transcriptional regulator [Fusibacter sp.]
MQSDNNVKNHILNTTVDMLESGYESDVMTIRKISQKANVSVGLINYHFGSKTELLLTATKCVIDRVAVKENVLLMDMSLPPNERLRKFLMDMATIVLRYDAFSKIMLHQEILSSSFSTPSYILGILKEMRPMATDESLKWLSIVVVAPLQYIFLKESGFKSYMGTDEIVTPQFIDQHLSALGL